MEENKKKIDETWKDSAAQEKQKQPGEERPKEQGFVPEEPDFNFFVTTLALQASIFLGAMPNPVTNKTEENIPQAKFVIDTLGMLKEKTAGNLTPEESSLLENVLYELRMQYLAKTGGK